MASDVSFLIPARNEIYLERTIQDVLKNIRGDSEIIVVLDGYLPEPRIETNDSRVTFLHYETAIGQRAAINAAAKVATGKYVVKLDAHCAIDEGMDVKLMADCEYDWTVVPRMYNLDHKTWLPKLHKRTDYMYIGLRENGELRSEYYTGREYKKWHNKSELIDDTMGLMGPCFFMHKDRYWELGGCDENHEGGWGQQGIEVAMKAMTSGGRLVVNKKTWFSHWFRGDIGFPYHLNGKQVARVRAYSKDLWLNNKWPGQKIKFEQILEKFNPPGWGKKEEEKMKSVNNKKVEFHEFTQTNRDAMYKKDPIESPFPWRWPLWRGIPVIKFPQDLLFYQQIIWNNKPDFLIETGTERGGSANFFADIMDMVGHGTVITIDRVDHNIPKHKRIIPIIGRTTACDTLETISKLISSGSSVMVSLDSAHDRIHVKRELRFYGAMVTKGQYLVVEDCFPKEVGAYEAVEAYLEKPDWPFVIVAPNDLLTLNVYLKRI